MRRINITRGETEKFMTKPEAPHGGLCLDLDTIDQELRQVEPYRRDGHTARTLLRAPDLRVVLIVMKAGSRMAEHRADESASVHVISGHVRLHLPERIAEVHEGQLLLLERDLAHDVEAVTDSALVLTLGWHGNS